MQQTTYALFDKIDEQFLMWKLVSWKSAREFRDDYINKHNVAIVKVVGTMVVGEMSIFSNRVERSASISLATAQKRYLPTK